jgi:NADH:ubiquinone oxidoreductase subunit 5 (subunit L)/multisubunit Na+/H+ antiporter MnhA subunit
MMVGIGTATPVGIAGGLFHMLNNTLYKTCLFLSAGAVKTRAGTSDLERLGGLAKLMPVTFAAFLIAALAISGVPPMNGFASKWMIYQGIIESGRGAGALWMVWLIAAMFGSALTLASFMKLLHAVFLGQPSSQIMRLGNEPREVGPTMRIPQVVLATLCVLFGVFAYQLPLQLGVFPALGGEVPFTGMWNASLATVLIVVGIGVGLVIYALGTLRNARQAEPFVGGERLDGYPQMRLSGVEFYRTVSELGPLKAIYGMAEHKVFDLYEVGTTFTLSVHRALRSLHNGILSTYLAWCLLGMMLLFWVLFR